MPPKATNPVPNSSIVEGSGVTLAIIPAVVFGVAPSSPLGHVETPESWQAYPITKDPMGAPLSVNGDGTHCW